MIFTVFLIINVVVLTMAVLTRLRPGPGPQLLVMGPEVSLGVRLGVVLIVAVASWLFAQMLYKMLVRGDEALQVNGVSPREAVGSALSLLSYLLLVVCAYAFLGMGVWYWLPVLFLVVLVWSLLSIWSLVGWLPMLAALALAAIAAFIVCMI
jgi:hypothetical protein